jgi:DNA (cytosine-5)-methyltransferase 1
MNGLALCAGIGGLELGLRLAIGDTYRTVCYVERDAFAAAILVARMEDAAMDRAPIWDDLTTFDGGAWRGVVDIVTSGFPCQPFSVSGKRRGIEDERWLWPDIARIVGDVGPRLVFLENVPGLVHHGLRVVWSDLRRMGFRVRAGFFSAAEVGAPHRRQRLFVLADRDLDGQQSERSGRLFDGERAACGHDADGCGAAVADAPQFCERESNNEERAKPRDDTRQDVGGRGMYVDAARRPGADGDESGWSSRPCWPPAPNAGRDGEGWPAGLEPFICRVADGPTDRLDRLRCIGNGVVPLVAAHAWRTLLTDAAMEGGEERFDQHDGDT